MSSAFHSWSDFWQMGGYAFYVWLAVAVTVIALLILFIHTRWQRRALLADIRRQMARERRVSAARKQSTMKGDAL
ncbi:heme exporter protein CcmD [Klebsiella aerogenes]|uniref:heme exporter protein CcmD n=1 Tax=Klebsiella aerogenes TaxID=548 RepID=UPI0022787C37|nr:heme exporter protein CcmD [Klebsiella aerogenes]MCY4766992.1 heme exporter protein CcmD [Klebsiella aerogenes]